MDLVQFLTWLASSAGAAGALSFIAERIPAFQALAPARKSLVHLAGSVILALAAYSILTYAPPEWLAAAAPWFQVVYGVVYTWIANQVLHRVDPQTKGGYKQ